MNNTTPQSTAALVLTSPLLITANYWTERPVIAASVWAFWGAGNFVYQTFIRQPRDDSFAHLRLTDDSSINIAGLVNLMNTETSVAACVSSCITTEHPTVIVQPLHNDRQPTIPQLSPQTPESTVPSTYPTVCMFRMRFNSLKGLIDLLYAHCISVATDVLQRGDVQSFLSTVSSYSDEAIDFFDAFIYPTLDRFCGYILVALAITLLAYLIPLNARFWQTRRAATLRLRDSLISLLSGDLLAEWIWRMDNPLSDALRAIGVVLFIILVSLEPAKAAVRAMLAAHEPWAGSTTFLEIDRSLKTFSEACLSVKATLENLSIDAKSACVRYSSRFADSFWAVCSSLMAALENLATSTKSSFLTKSSSLREAFERLSLGAKSVVTKYALRLTDSFAVLGQYIFSESGQILERIRCLLWDVLQRLQAAGDRACSGILRAWRRVYDIPYTVGGGVALGLFLLYSPDLRLWTWHVLIIPSVMALVSVLRFAYCQSKLKTPVLQPESPKLSPRRGPPQPMDLTSSILRLQLPEDSPHFLDFASSNIDLPTGEESPMPGSWPPSPSWAEKFTPTTLNAAVPADTKQALSDADEVRIMKERIRRTNEERAQRRAEMLAEYARCVAAQEARRIAYEERIQRGEEEQARRDEEEEARREEEKRALYAAAAASEKNRREEEEQARIDASQVAENSSSGVEVGDNAPRSYRAGEAIPISDESNKTAQRIDEAVDQEQQAAGQPNYSSFASLVQHTKQKRLQSEQQQNGPLSVPQHHLAISGPDTADSLVATSSLLNILPSSSFQSHVPTSGPLQSDIVASNPFTANYISSNAVPSTPLWEASNLEPPVSGSNDIDDDDDLSSIGSIDPHDFSMLGPEFGKDPRDSDGDHEMADPPAPIDEDLDMTDVQEDFIPVEEDVEMELDVSPTHSPTTGGPPQEQMFTINYLPQLDPSILMPASTDLSGNFPIPEIRQGFQDDIMISPDKETFEIAATDNGESYSNSNQVELEKPFDVPAFVQVNERNIPQSVQDNEDLYAPPDLNAPEPTHSNPSQNAPPELTQYPAVEEPETHYEREDTGTTPNSTGNSLGMNARADCATSIDPALLTTQMASNAASTLEAAQASEKVLEEQVASASDSPAPPSVPSSTFTTPDRDSNSQRIETFSHSDASQPSIPVVADPIPFTAGPTSFAAGPTSFTAGSSDSTAPKPVQRTKVSGRPHGSKSPFSYIGEAKAAHNKPERRKSQPGGRFGSSFAPSKIATGSKSAGTSRVASPTTPSAPSTPQPVTIVRPKLPLSRKKFGNGVQGTRFESPTTPTIPLLADAHASFSTSADRKGKKPAALGPSRGFEDWVDPEVDENKVDDSYGTVEVQRRPAFRSSTSSKTNDQTSGGQVYSGQISVGDISGGHTPGLNWEEATDDDAKGETDDELYGDAESVESEEL